MADLLAPSDAMPWLLEREHRFRGLADDTGHGSVNGPANHSANERDTLGEGNDGPLCPILCEEHEAGLFVDFANHCHRNPFDGLHDDLLADLDSDGFCDLLCI